MKKLFLLLSAFLFLLIQSTSFAEPGAFENLPKDELKKYNALSSQAQSEALERLQKMGSYDPERMHIDQTGHFFIVDDSLEKILKDNGMKMPSISPPAKKNVISDNPPAGYTPEGVPIFHSFPGSPNVIYLNFVGALITGTAWNDFYGFSSFAAQPYIPAAYNPNRLPGFPPAVQNAIAGIWGRVAEDYAPWQIDVTTEAPSAYTSTTLVALITQNVTVDGKPMPSSSAGGVAYLDVFGFFDAQYYSPALIYYNNLANGNEDAVADVVSHEIGHNFGLSHEGVLNGTPYYPGAGSGEISWGCIMGAPYFKTVAKFCNGDYPNANNKEDQVAIINQQLPFRSPSAGNSISTAASLPIDNGTFKFSGIIENYTTSNFFSLNNVSGTLSVSAITYRRNVDTLGNNLCLALRLLDTTGNVIASSSNPLSCSATITANSLPVGTYFVQVYPVGNPITPFPVYGSMGQYDLVGTATTLRITPPFSTVRLLRQFKFDAYETLYVSGGVPPYTYSSKLNAFSRSGTGYVYKATKPGLEVITVTDSKGSTATASITVSHVDFGGMYGNSRTRNFNNPITGTFGCPAGYSSQMIMGSQNVDYPLYYCYRQHRDAIPANYDFGGIYSGSGTGLRPNPLTGGASCPTGYTSAQVYGDDTHSPDYPVYFCYKTHNELIQEAASFGGMYAPAENTTYNNPITGRLTCPTGATGTMMLGTYNVDYFFYFCAYPPPALKISPPFTNLALNNTMIFDVNEATYVSGGTPPYSYSAKLGTFTPAGTKYTYTASKPGLDTITVVDSKGNTAKANVTVGYIDFGGMYGYSKDGNFNNPTTSTLDCPVGYSKQQVMGTDGVDYPLYYCYRMHAKGVPADFDFGGMYSYSGTGVRVNPLTGAESCPPQYTSARVYGDNSNSRDYPAYLCYKTHNESIEEAGHFRGMYAPAYYTNYNNPITGAQSCPSGALSAMMLGTYNIDYFFYFCY